MYNVELKDITKRFGLKTILENFNISFDSRNINCVLGESGGGKTTMLNIIAGILKEDSGQIIGVEKEDISYIFQEDRLLPWLTVKENLSLALSRYFKGEKLEKRIDYVLQLVKGIDWKNEYPQKLSGGMRQRVNIARALGKDGKILLMDEPFKSLDYKTKMSIMKDLKEILKIENRLVIFVTHDIEECIFFNGKVFILGGNPLKIKGVYENNLKEEKEAIINLL